MILIGLLLGVGVMGLLSGPRPAPDSPAGAPAPMAGQPVPGPAPQFGQKVPGQSGLEAADMTSAPADGGLESQSVKAGAKFDNPGALPMFGTPVAAGPSDKGLGSLGGTSGAWDGEGSGGSNSKAKGTPAPPPPKKKETPSTPPSTLSTALGAAAAPIKDALDYAQAAALPAVLYVVNRKQWHAAASTAGEGKHSPTKITFHHTSGHLSSELEESKQQMQNIQYFHKVTRGWGDIGYHYVVDGEGRIFEGRPEDQVGAHTKGQNEGNIGIALMGNYNTVVPSGPQVLGLINAASVEALKRNMDVDAPDFIMGHKDYQHGSENNTDCPGTMLHNMLPQIRRIVAEKVKKARASSPSLVTIQPLPSQG